MKKNIIRKIVDSDVFINKIYHTINEKFTSILLKLLWNIEVDTFLNLCESRRSIVSKAVETFL